MRLFIRFLLFIFLIFSLSCQDNSDSQNQQEFSSEDIQKSLEKANRYLVRTENERIDAYVNRHNLNMQRTGSGLRYIILEKGNGRQIQTGDTVSIKYVVKFLTGDIVYTSEERGIMTFVAGKGGVESGLEEAILLLQKGDKATIILPSHLAFGLLGDENKIPPKTALVYEIEVLN